MRHILLFLIIALLSSCVAMKGGDNDSSGSGGANELGPPNDNDNDGIADIEDVILQDSLIIYFDEGYEYFDEASDGSASYEVIEEMAEAESTSYYDVEYLEAEEYTMERIASESHAMEMESDASSAMTTTPQPAPVIIPKEDEIAKGSMTYSVSDTMEVGKTYDVELRISRILSNAISDGLLDAEDVVTISTSNTMEVLLFDPDPEKEDPVFIIKKLTEAKQWLEPDSSHTTWLWTVKPLRTGDHRLKLIINIIKDGNKKSITVFEQDVKIKATSKSFTYKARKWWRSNWKWSFTTLILPFIAWWWKRRKDKEKSTSTET